MVHLIRGQVMHSARGYLEGSQLQAALDAIEDIEPVIFNSSRGRTRLAAIYQDVKPGKNFYVNYMEAAPLEREFFFKRFCVSFCLLKSKFRPGGLLSPTDMCNIVVRNTLDFYRAFQCFPEDYMGEVQVCKVF
ncbi:unnamed protein product [Ixodes hexagonus]